MRVIFYNHIINIFVVAVSFMYATAAARERERILKDFLETRRRDKPLERLLESPASNMYDIKTLYLSPGDGFVALTIYGIREALGKPRSLEYRTALNILLVNALRTKTLDANMPDRSYGATNARWKLPSTVMDQILGETEDTDATLQALVSPLVDGFTKLHKSPSDVKLLAALMQTINSLLADARITAKMSVADKQMVLEKYLRSPKSPLAKCRPEQVVLIYKNLGFIDEVKRLCAVSSDGGETISVLERRMKLAASAELADEAIACADRLLEVVKKKVNITCYDDVVATYARFRPNEALVKFKDECGTSAFETVTMYRTACAFNQYGNEASRRRDWLDHYIGEAEQNCIRNENVDKARQLVWLHALAYELEANDCPDAALYVADRILEIKALLGERRIVVTMGLVERCNKALGRNDDTRKTFAKCLENKELDESARHYASSWMSTIDDNED